MTAQPLTDRRSIKAASIVAAGDVVQVRPGLWHVTDRNGSGREHVTTKHTCTCEDKARHPEVRCKHQRSVDMQQPVCPTCGAATRIEAYHVGGRGQCWFRICTADKYHKATRLS